MLWDIMCRGRVRTTAVASGSRFRACTLRLRVLHQITLSSLLIWTLPILDSSHHPLPTHSIIEHLWSDCRWGWVSRYRPRWPCTFPDPSESAWEEQRVTSMQRSIRRRWQPKLIVELLSHWLEGWLITSTEGYLSEKLSCRCLSFGSWCI